MDTLTIKIRNPKVKDLISSLAEMNLIAILPPKQTWSERWQSLSATLPDVAQISEQDILDEISTVRQQTDKPL